MSEKSRRKLIRDRHSRDTYFKIAAKVIKAYRHHEYWRESELDYTPPHQKLP